MEITDIGGDDKIEKQYYEVASEAAQMIQKGEAEKAVLFCSTGMGVAIVANKFKGIYASVIESEFAAQMCRKINNANVLTMGSMMISEHKTKNSYGCMVVS